MQKIKTWGFSPSPTAHYFDEDNPDGAWAQRTGTQRNKLHQLLYGRIRKTLAFQRPLKIKLPDNQERILLLIYTVITLW